MADPGFVHLHVHSSYSLLQGALPIARLAELAKADRQPALALTDTDNMFWRAGVLREDSGERHPADRRLRALPSTLATRRRAPGPAPERPRIVLLAAREDGYRSLMRLTSRAFLESPSHERPHAKIAWLEGATDGLIALTGGSGGPLDMAIVAGQGDAGAGALRQLSCGCSGTGSTSSCSAMATTVRPRPL